MISDITVTNPDAFKAWGERISPTLEPASINLNKTISGVSAGYAVPSESGETKSRRPRRNHTPGFKAKVALAAIKGHRTLAQQAEQFDVHPKQIRSWKAQLEEGAADVFGSGGGNGGAQPAIDVKSLHAKSES